MVVADVPERGDRRRCTGGEKGLGDGVGPAGREDHEARAGEIELPDFPGVEGSGSAPSIPAEDQRGEGPVAGVVARMSGEVNERRRLGPGNEIVTRGGDAA